MASRRKDFKQEDVIKALLWCARHCCLCGKGCSTGIEVAHIDPRGTAEIDNAIPLCFDCHEQIGSYNPNHPKGRSYRPAELKQRREQIYERYTSHLVPPLLYNLSQRNRQLPDVGFEIAHTGGPHPVKVRVMMRLAQGTINYGLLPSSHYDGRCLWNLNPGFVVSAHFALPADVVADLQTSPIRMRIDVIVLDIYQRAHDLLPLGYILSGSGSDWYLEPSEEVLNIPSTSSVVTGQNVARRARK